MTPTRSKLDRVPNYPMDPITQVLRTRPEALRDILKAFGGWIFRNKGWALPLWQEATESHKYAILNKRTYHWRMCLVGARRGRRGWLAELLLSSPTLRGYPQPERPLQLAKLIQSGETGEWPELQIVCTEESEILRKRLAGYPSPLLLDTSHGWPYEPDQAPNVVPFLRPWRGPRGDGGAA